MTTSEENTEWNELQWLNDDRFVATLAAILLGRIDFSPGRRRTTNLNRNIRRGCSC